MRVGNRRGTQELACFVVLSTFSGPSAPGTTWSWEAFWSGCKSANHLRSTLSAILKLSDRPHDSREWSELHQDQTCCCAVPVVVIPRMPHRTCCCAVNLPHNRTCDTRVANVRCGFFFGFFFRRLENSSVGQKITFWGGGLTKDVCNLCVLVLQIKYKQKCEDEI